ncbi:MAG TPA: hypothetical protein PLB55_03670 [Prosthecobacter sp.]|nr:hypothetical protein [Prosthecobacter sp.]
MPTRAVLDGGGDVVEAGGATESWGAQGGEQGGGGNLSGGARLPAGLKSDVFKLRSMDAEGGEKAADITRFKTGWHQQLDESGA